ncbi:HAMP domain-containing protein [Alteromonas pelagimontana]|uniref:HAMP domain-containing protein n=1 Tax=Alteromonas pelagimontana TaxID=1858656 RepID=A0A6M4MHS3_9ALTE|nr:Cache 3/Cache 2 fusion domain-containing protein [Alteromonas pelagimontana]QJR81716.1 HAMP domain-containing protein [Alteromonas pelagimontana]
MSIQRKFLFSVAGVIGFFTLVVLGYSIYTNSRTVEAQIEKEQKAATSQIIDILRVTDTIMRDRVQSSMKLLMQRGAELGLPAQGDMIRVKATSAYQLLLGNQPQANNFALVDELTDVMGGTATLFSKTGSDFIRISTNVKNQGERAIGTRLATDGQAIKKIQQKQPFYGQVDILGNPYLTGYEPMLDGSGNVIGIWYVGYSADMKFLKEAIADSRILQSGFVALRDSNGSVRIHSDHVTTEQAESILRSSTDEWTITEVPFEFWNYDIVLAVSHDETEGLLAKALGILFIKILIAGGAILVTIYFLVKRIVGKPLNHFTDVVENIASGEGDLTFRFDSTRNDEFGRMANGFNLLLAKLQTTIQVVSSATDSLLQRSSELQATAVKSNNSIMSLTSQTDRIANAIDELQENASRVASNTSLANEAAQTADKDTTNSVSVLNMSISDIERQAEDVDASVAVINPNPV